MSIYNDWRAFLYFSRGERRSLTFLLILVVTGSALLMITDIYRQASDTPAPAQPAYIVNPSNTPVIPIDSIADANITNASTTDASTAANRRQERTYPDRRYQRRQAPAFQRQEKFPAGTVVELNTADTTVLKKVPGIGSYFAGKIVGLRASLGGFYSVGQLRGVYGMDEERYLTLKDWFHADTTFIAKWPVNILPADSLAKHPYISYKQARIIRRLSDRKEGLKGWSDLSSMEEFTPSDIDRLRPYLSFE